MKSYKVPERCAIFDPKTEELITDENEILATTLKYNIGVDWKILSTGKVFNPVTKKCKLCLKEKFLIMFSPKTATLNARMEMYNTCSHRLTKLHKNSKT